jgi:creatinine amidohydrolase
MDVEAYLKRDDRVILITGAVEQHSTLSLFTDILIPTHITRAVSERTGVLVAPPFNFGVSDVFMEYPGTITIRQTTFELVLREIIDSLRHHGFRRFFIFNGHGGNQRPAFLDELDARAVWYDWWLYPAALAFQSRHGLVIGHANWGENFPFTRLGSVPTGEKPVVSFTTLPAGESMRAAMGDGSSGGAYQVDDALTEELFAMLVDEVAALVNAL